MAETHLCFSKYSSSGGCQEQEGSQEAYLNKEGWGGAGNRMGGSEWRRS